MSDPLKLGVVGLRNIGKGHVRRCLDLPHANVIAVADAREDRLAEVREEFGDVDGYTDAADLITRDDLDGVVLAVPNHVHAPLAIAAMEAGKHVLVEKPISGFSISCSTCSKVPFMSEIWYSNSAMCWSLVGCAILQQVRSRRTEWL